MSDTPRLDDDARSRGIDRSDTSARAAGDLSRRRFVQAAAAAGAGALAFGGAGSASAQSVARENCEGDFAEYTVGDDGDYVMINNDWGNPDADQCIYEYDDGTIGWDFCCGSSDINYPEVYLGTRPWGGDTGVPEWSGLTHGDVDELIMEYDVDIDIDGTWNLAPEYWLLEGEPGEDPALTHEIMLVCDHADSHSHGGTIEDEAFSDQFGNSFDYWAFYNEGGTSADFHIFRLSERSSCGRVDWGAIVDFIDDQPGVNDDLTMTGIELGTEYWDDASGEVHVNTFDVTINGSTYSLGVESDCAGGDPDPTPPDAPDDVSVESTSTDSVTVEWDSVSDADEYDVYVDDSFETTETSTSTTIDGLSSDTDYTIGVEASNDEGTSDQTTTTATTDEEEDEPDDCPTGDGETLSNGNTVCDVDGDGWHRDLDASGDVTSQDLEYFFQNQHRDPYDSRDDLFDFNQDGSVGQPDVVDLFQYL